MRWKYLLPLGLLFVGATPPYPPGYKPKVVTLSPKQLEQVRSLGTPMAKTSVQVPQAPIQGFVVTNIVVTNGQVTLQWQQGDPVFRVQGTESISPVAWTGVGNFTTARQKVFSIDHNQFFRVVGSNYMQLSITQTNPPTLTWFKPDVDMSDSLTAFRVYDAPSVPPNDTPTNTVGWTLRATIPPTSPLTYNDTTQPAPGAFKVIEVTANGVVVPYNLVTSSPTQPGTAVWAHGYGGTGKDFGAGIDIDSIGFVYGCGTYGGDTFDANFGTGTMHPFGTASVWIGKYRDDGEPVWTKGIGVGAGSSGNCAVNAFAIAVRGGFVAVVGSFSGTCDFSGVSAANATKTAIATPATDIFVALYDDVGVFQWVKTFGTPTVDGFGAHLPCGANAVAIDSSGNVLVTGFFEGAVNFGDATRTCTQGANIFVLKLLAANGATSYSLMLGGTTAAIQRGNAVAVDSSDNTYATGSYAGTSDFGNSHILTAPGGAAHQAIFVAKYSSGGSCQWAKSYGGLGINASGGSDAGQSITIDSDNNVGVGGALLAQGENVGGDTLVAGGFIAKYSGSTGNHVWSLGFSVGGSVATPSGWVYGIKADQNNNFVLAGGFGHTLTVPGTNGPITVTTPGSTGIFIIKFAGPGSGTSGLALWAKGYGSTGGQYGDGGQSYPAAVAIGPDNSPVTIGTYQSTAPIGGGIYALSIDSFVMPTIGREDVFLVKSLP